MLSKHKVSKLNTVLGMSLCVVISAFALTKAPLSMAKSRFLTDDPISMKFQQITLAKTLEIVANYNKLPIFNMDIINENITVFIQVTDFPADVIFNELLECGGLEFTEYESGIELRQVKQVGKMPVNYCLITENAHHLMEAEEINVIDAEGNMLGKNAKMTRFR